MWNKLEKHMKKNPHWPADLLSWQGAGEPLLPSSVDIRSPYPPPFGDPGHSREFRLAQSLRPGPAQGPAALFQTVTHARRMIHCSPCICQRQRHSNKLLTTTKSTTCMYTQSVEILRDLKGDWNIRCCGFWFGGGGHGVEDQGTR